MGLVLPWPTYRRRVAGDNAVLTISVVKETDMNDLIEYLSTRALPTTSRPNVSPTPVQSITLGMVNVRQSSVCQIGEATTHDRFHLLRRLLALLQDPDLTGQRPTNFTSICCNVDYACALHTDKYNSGCSHIIAGGDYRGGEFFLEGGEGEAVTIQHEGCQLQGAAVDIRHAWCVFDGKQRHMTMPYSNGRRVSVVFFSVPLDKCDARDLVTLRSLGFIVPNPFALDVPFKWPYQIRICTAGRAQTIAQDTLGIISRDRSVPTHCITLCVKEPEVDAYRGFGFDVMTVSGAAGLPEQRQQCLRGMPHGSWALFLDDDLTDIMLLEEMSLHELVVLGFLSAKARGAELWGLNVSKNRMHLRDTVSTCPGLVNGYFFGVVTSERAQQMTPVSDTVGGAGEDVERTLRYYEAGGVLRMNFACAVARTQTNAGGLQGHYKDRAARRAAHEFVIRSLAVEFPQLVIFDDCSANKSTFLQARGQAEEHKCHLCDKAFTRKNALAHHKRWFHPDPALPQPELIECPNCKRTFRSKKAMLVHVRALRCHSNRGRKYDSNAPPKHTDV